MKRILFHLLIAIFFLMMLFHAEITVEGAKTGLLLWFHSIIPALLPFMILSNLLVYADALHLFTFFLAPFAKFFYHLSPNGSYALITGLFCGYPMGAKSCADLVNNKKISRLEGQFLLCFCNNVSPAFVISYLCDSILQKSLPVWYFLAAIYISPLLTGILLRPVFFRKHTKEKKSSSFSPFLPAKPSGLEMLDQSIMNGFETVTKLGGYIILFSILSSFIKNMSFLSSSFKCFLLPLTEITTGIHYLASYVPDAASAVPWKFMGICACASFGGLSGIAQTQSIIKDSGLSIIPYIFSKTGISILSAGIYFLCTLLVS